MVGDNAENFNFKLTNLSDNRTTKPSQKKEKRVLRPPTLKSIHDQIDRKDFDPVLKEELKKSAAKFPHHALHVWIENYDKYLTKARQDVRDRLISESNKKNATSQNQDLEKKDVLKIEDISLVEDNDASLGLPPEDYDPTA